MHDRAAAVSTQFRSQMPYSPRNAQTTSAASKRSEPCGDGAGAAYGTRAPGAVCHTSLPKGV
jgi:hypothetical protein